MQYKCIPTNHLHGRINLYLPEFVCFKTDLPKRILPAFSHLNEWLLFLEIPFVKFSISINEKTE
ncbi:hypothetical protein T01_7995 [Trichinella spiralis]|uniref:Uncharacterized protein n=1 Tax=Trichinella spiralis TaxID=6334 RepID=A0A0V1AK05_TRISP|nr:hypothetical protein T01_7995 [Trichinella spiralis]